MPKSKVRKKPPAQAHQAAAALAGAGQEHAKVVGPSSPVYVAIMVGLMLLGLAWMVVYYLWGASVPLISSLGSWNFIVGFGLMIVGLLMTMRWR